MNLLKDLKISGITFAVKRIGDEIMQIPFNKPYLTGKEKKYIQDVLQRRELSGDGYYTEKVTSLLEKIFH